MNTFSLVRQAIRTLGRRPWPRFIHARSPWDGIDHLYAMVWQHAHLNGAVSTVLSNLVLVRNGALLCVRGLGSDCHGTAQITTWDDLFSLETRALAAVVAEAVQSGEASVDRLAPGLLRGPEIFLNTHLTVELLNRDDFLDHLPEDERQALRPRLTEIFSSLRARAYYAWCRAVERHCEPAVLAAVEADLHTHDKDAANTVAKARRGEVMGHFQMDVTPRPDGIGAIMASLPKPWTTIPSDRIPAHLPHCVLLGYTNRYRDLLAAGEGGARAWADLKATWPWLAHQALTDAPFFRALLAGRQMAPLVERRLGVSRTARRSWEVAVPGLAALYRGPESPQAPGHDHPILGDGFQSLSGGHRWRCLARTIDWLPDALRPDAAAGLEPAAGGGSETLERLPLRAALLERLFERVWFHPHGISVYHPKRWLPGPGMSTEGDWRVRAPLYACRNMKAMVANGGLHLETLDRDRVDDLIGLAEDVHNMRVWCLVQTVGAEIARLLHDEWATAGSPSLADLPDELRERLGRVHDRAWRILPPEAGLAWFAMGAAGLCSDKSPALYAAFSHVAMPRSVKRLRRAVDRFHQLLASRGMMIARGEGPEASSVRSWPPLFEGGRLILPDLPGIEAVCLTGTDMLAEEGQAMGHCVGGYGSRCEGGANHILSIRDADGQRLSTLHIAIAPETGYGPTMSFRPKVAEHRGLRNNAPPESAAEFADLLVARFAAPDLGGLVLTKDALRPRYGSQDVTLIEHDPWADDAAAREDEVYRILADTPFTRDHARTIAARLIDRPFGWTCPWPVHPRTA